MVFKRKYMTPAVLAASAFLAASVQAHDAEDQMGPPGEHFIDCTADGELTFLYPDTNMALIRYGCANSTFHALMGKTVYPEAKKICDYNAASLEDSFEVECRDLTEAEISADDLKAIERQLDLARAKRRDELRDDTIAYGKINRYFKMSSRFGEVLFNETGKPGKAGYVINFNLGTVKSQFAARDGEAGHFEMSVDDAEKMPHTGKIVNNARGFLQSLKPRPVQP